MACSSDPNLISNASPLASHLLSIGCPWECPCVNNACPLDIAKDVGICKCLGNGTSTGDVIAREEGCVETCIGTPAGICVRKGCRYCIAMRAAFHNAFRQQTAAADADPIVSHCLCVVVPLRAGHPISFQW